jgi:hypothetical protein
MTESADHRNGVPVGAKHDADVSETRVLYCHCKYAKVIDPDVKAAVLAGLTAADVGFEAVADLCEMSARKDPSLARLAAPGEARIAACFPRAVKWLFHAAGSPIDPGEVEVLNMREQSADEVLAALLRQESA